MKLQSGRTHRGVQLQAGGCHIINEEGGGGGGGEHSFFSFSSLFPHPPSFLEAEHYNNTNRVESLLSIQRKIR